MMSPVVLLLWIEQGLLESVEVHSLDIVKFRTLLSNISSTVMLVVAVVRVGTMYSPSA
jgi:hypothetical protein